MQIRVIRVVRVHPRPSEIRGSPAAGRGVQSAVVCRFLSYQGSPVLLADLVVHPEHSLVKQSYGAEQLAQPLNGDGFGLAWYSPEIDPTPGVFKSITPAWNDQNLQSIATKIRSSHVFAHVRAASPGLIVQRSNCHPFAYGQYAFMHNGSIGEFVRLKRPIQESLSEAAFSSIHGSTDSEHLFAMLLDAIGDRTADLEPAALREALVETIARLAEIAARHHATAPCYLNLAATDGRSTVVSRFATGGSEPATLYYSAGRQFSCGRDGVCEMIEADEADRHAAVIVASEPLTRRAEHWTPVPPQHTITISPDLRVEVAPILHLPRRLPTREG